VVPSVELVQELGRRATVITGDCRQNIYLFNQLSVAWQKGNAVSFQNTFTAGVTEICLPPEESAPGGKIMVL